MKRFIAKEKMSKKAQREINRARRRVWETDPRPRVVESGKVYNRKRIARAGREDRGTGDFLFLSKALRGAGVA